MHNDSRWHRLTPSAVDTVRDRLTPRARLLVWPDMSADIRAVLESLPDRGVRPARTTRATSGCRCRNSFIGAHRAAPPLMTAVLPDSDGILRARWTP